MKRILPVFLLVNLMFPACAPVSVPTSTLTPAPGVTPLLTPTAPPTGTATPTETPTATPQPTETPEQNPTTTEELIGVLAEKLGGGIEWSGADVYPQYFDPIRHNIILTESFGGQQKSAVAENPVWKKYDPNTPGKAFHLLRTAFDELIPDLNREASQNGPELKIHYIIKEDGSLIPTSGTAPFRLKEGEEIVGIIHIFKGPPHVFPIKSYTHGTAHLSTGVGIMRMPEDPTRIIIVNLVSEDDDCLYDLRKGPPTREDWLKSAGFLASQKISGWLIDALPNRQDIRNRAVVTSTDMTVEEMYNEKGNPLRYTPLIFVVNNSLK